MREQARLWWLALAVATTIVAVDQLTKTMAIRALADGPIDVVWTLRLNLTFNSGAAFGLAKGVTPLVVGAGVLLLVAVLVTGRRLASVLAAIAIGLVLGGAVGNLTDRFVRRNGGAVVDFIDLQWWPVFNVADMAISIGAVLLVVAGLRDETRAGETAASAQ